MGREGGIWTLLKLLSYEGENHLRGEGVEQSPHSRLNHKICIKKETFSVLAR